MRWFRGRARDDARPALSRGGTVTAMGQWPTSYAAQLRGGYLENPVAQRAVRMVAEAVASAPMEASDPALLALVTRQGGGPPLFEAAATQLLLHGNAYLQLIGDGQGGVAELFALRPERVSMEADAHGWPVAYRYQVGEQAVRLAAGLPGERPEVLHVRAFHPGDDHYGLGCLGGAAGAIAIHNAAARWNKALLDNAARPSGALVYDAGDGAAMAPAQFDRLRAELETAFAGSGNAGRPMLLEGGLRWQQMSLSPADMDFAGLKAQAAREIALAFGVPPMLLGLPGDNTYANYREANRALWRLTVLPLAQRLCRAVLEGLQPWFPDAWLEVDPDKVPALSEDRERLWRQVTAAPFLSDAEKRQMLGFDAAGGPGGARRGADASPGGR